MSTNDHLDTTRERYISHKLYLKRRTANRYYNLGYMMYKTIFIATPEPIPSGSEKYVNSTNANVKDAIQNFEVALLFNSNDIDAKERKKTLCEFFGPGIVSDPTGTGKGQKITQADLISMTTNAKRIHKNCAC